MSALPGTTGRRRIYLMRHGHVNYMTPAVQAGGMRDVRLTALGREQVLAQNANAVPTPETESDLVELTTACSPR